MICWVNVYAATEPLNGRPAGALWRGISCPNRQTAVKEGMNVSGPFRLVMRVKVRMK